MDNKDIMHLAHVAKELLEAMDKGADKMLPQEVVDVVKLHSKLAVGSAWIPLPGADVAAGAATIWSMYVRINNKIGLALGDNILKTIASGVATNLASYAAMSGVASALKFIPGIGSLGGALIMSASLYAITLCSGYVYLKALLLLAKKNGGKINVNELGNAIKEVLKNKSEINDFINTAKSDYKVNKGK